jgi:acetyl-CoA carboxylase biotin carboxyl carrier protein
MHAPNLLSPSNWKQLAQWLAEADVDCLELSEPGLRLRLVRGVDGYVVEQAQPLAGPPTAEPKQVTAATAPCAGLFLAAHPAQPSPLAVHGNRVRAGDVVGLLQIGLLLVPVVAPTAGVISDILIPPGTLVGYGRPIVAIKLEDN